MATAKQVRDSIVLLAQTAVVTRVILGYKLRECNYVVTTLRQHNAPSSQRSVITTLPKTSSADSALYHRCVAARFLDQMSQKATRVLCLWPMLYTASGCRSHRQIMHFRRCETIYVGANWYDHHEATGHAEYKRWAHDPD